MSELRKDPLHERWVIVSPERGKRPGSFLTSRRTWEFCPFCEGNEWSTPPEIVADREPGSRPNEKGWRVRVFPNKFPALRIEGVLDRKEIGIFSKMGGLGAHEIIVETPEHEKPLQELSEDHIERVIRIYRHRIEDLYRDNRLKYVIVFKNWGDLAGASIPHSHSQVIAIPIIPKNLRDEYDKSTDYFKRQKRCIFCNMIRDEIKSEKRIVYENQYFIACTAFASAFPFETHILPKTHSCNFTSINEGEICSLADVLKIVLKKLMKATDNAPYNFVIHNAPNPTSREVTWELIDKAFHWHIEIIPRLTRIAGFEWGTGFYINPVSPEDAAQYLREV